MTGPIAAARSWTDARVAASPDNAVSIVTTIVIAERLRL